jgi:glycopeptide antibiotics resistance protein
LENKLTFIVKNSTQLYLGWVLIIALLTLLPGGAIPNFNWNLLAFDKWIHFGIFAILSWLGILSFKKQNNWLSGRAIFISISLAILYGTFLEFSQALVPERMFDYNDLIANCAGALFGFALYRGLNKILQH